MIDKVSFYENLYAHLYDVTPLEGDCGALCGARCCQDSEEASGMYLYPGERALYKNSTGGFCIEPSDFFYDNGRCADFLSCPGRCDRALRPLACRIFPLAPYVADDGYLRIILDPRAKGMCPLYDKGAAALSPRFIKNVTYVLRALFLVREVRQFIYAQSRLIDDYIKDCYL